MQHPVERFWTQVINAQRLELIAELMSDDYRQHAPGIAQGPAGVRAFLEDVFAHSEGMHASVVGWLEIDDLVITKTTIVFKTPPPGWEPSNDLVDVFRIREGRLVEHWDIASYGAATDR